MITLQRHAADKPRDASRTTGSRALLSMRLQWDLNKELGPGLSCPVPLRSLGQLAQPQHWIDYIRPDMYVDQEKWAVKA